MACDRPPDDLIIAVNIKGEICAFTRDGAGQRLWQLDTEDIFGPILRLNRRIQKTEVEENILAENSIEDSDTLVQNWIGLGNRNQHAERDGYAKSCVGGSDIFVEPVGSGFIYFDIGGILHRFDRSISDLSSSKVSYRGNITFVGRKESNVIYMDPCDGVLVEHIGTSVKDYGMSRTQRNYPLVPLNIDSHRLIVDSRGDGINTLYELDYLSFYIARNSESRRNENSVATYDAKVSSSTEFSFSRILKYTYEDKILRIFSGMIGDETWSGKFESPPVALFHFYLDSDDPSRGYKYDEISAIVESDKINGSAFVLTNSINGACYILPNIGLSEHIFVDTLGVYSYTPTLKSNSIDVNVRVSDNTPGLLKPTIDALDIYKHNYLDGRVMISAGSSSPENSHYPVVFSNRPRYALGGADHKSVRDIFSFVAVVYLLSSLIANRRFRSSAARVLGTFLAHLEGLAYEVVAGVTRYELPAMILAYLKKQDLHDFAESNAITSLESGEHPPYAKEINTTIFKLGEILGAGSNGTVVFKAFLRGKEIAVKRVLSDFYDLAKKEVKILEMSDFHKNIIRYYSYEEVGPFIYIGLELCYGSLYEFIEFASKNEYLSRAKERLSSNILMHQIASGVCHLHSLHIAHRDIKPHNILIAPDFHCGENVGFRVVVSDFGLGKVVSSGLSLSQTATGVAGKGTVGWRAPEVILRCSFKSDASGASSSQEPEQPWSWRVGKSALSNAITGQISTPADIFSMGCCFYYIHSKGKHPFDPLESRETNIIRNRKPCLDAATTDKVLSDLLFTMLLYSPKSRPSCLSVLNNPVFWDNTKRLVFLADFSDVSRFDKTKVNRSLITDVESDKSIFGGDWFQRIPRVLMNNFGRMSTYKSYSLLSLLRFIRNIKNHIWNLNAQEKLEIGENYDQIMSFFNKAFPSLFIHIYRIASKYSKHLDDDFKRKYFSSL